MKAMVLCGGKPQEYLVKELKNIGYTVLVVDQNELAPAVLLADKYFSVSPLDVDRVRKIAIEEHVDFVMSVCADQMLLVAAQVSEELGLPCYIDYETAKNVSSKEYMKRIFVENNIPTSKHIVRESLDLVDVQEMKYPLIVKPVDCYSSRGVKRVETDEELRIAFENAVKLSRTNNAVIEEFVGGDEYSVDFYIENGEANLLCMRVLDKIPNYDGFVICRGRYPACLTDKMENKIRVVGQQIADAFGLKDTPMLVQMKIDGERISVIEFCARTGGGIKYRLLPIVSGFDVVKAVMELTLGKKPHCDVKKYDGYIIDEFLYCNPGKLESIKGFEELQKAGVIDHYELYKKPGYEFKEASCSGDRVAYFSVKADTKFELERLHQLAISGVSVLSTEGKELIRKDIVKL